MNWFQNKPLNFKIKFIIIVNFASLILAYLFVKSYKLFSILITSILLCNLSYQFFNSFVQLIDLKQCNKPSNVTKLQFNLYNFLFKNEQIYQIFSKLLKYKLNRHKKLETIFEVSDQDSADKNGKTHQNLMKQIDSFVDKISENFIETWYFAYISNDGQFISESKLQLQLVFKDLIDRFIHLNKIDLFSKLILILNKNFINFGINCELSKVGVPIEKLHPALRFSPESEKIFIKKFVLLVLRKSGNILDVNNQFLEELFMQLIGKNCVQKIVDLVSKPQFLYFAICCALDREKTYAARAEVEVQPQEIFYSGSDDDIESVDLSEEIGLKNELENQLKAAQTPQLSMKNPIYATMDKTENNLFLEIFNIGITGSEIGKEPKTGKEFTNYLIQFDYKFSSSSSDLNKDSGNDNTEIITKQIKRRYKEFVSLQKSLDEQFHLKNFKGPSKFNSPIGNMEFEIVEKRRIKLNTYLNSLICLTEICQSKDFINFLGLNSNNENIKENQNSSLFKSVSETLFDRNSSKLDPIVNFANILPNSFEYTKEDTFRKFRGQLSVLLKETSILYENIFKSENLNETNSLNEISFGKNLLEIFNKLMLSASLVNNLPANFWFNHKNVYKLIECTVCEFYAERFFEDLLNKLMSYENLTFYFQNLESTLFAKPQQAKYNDPDYQIFIETLLQKKIPDLIKKIFGKRLDYSISVFINCLKHEILNKHFVYSVLEVLLPLMYPEEYDQTKS